MYPVLNLQWHFNVLRFRQLDRDQVTMLFALKDVQANFAILFLSVNCKDGDRRTTDYIFSHTANN